MLRAQVETSVDLKKKRHNVRSFALTLSVFTLEVKLKRRDTIQRQSSNGSPILHGIHGF